MKTNLLLRICSALAVVATPLLAADEPAPASSSTFTAAAKAPAKAPAVARKVVQPVAQPRVFRFSAGVPEVLRMVLKGVDNKLVLTFVQNSSVAYQPTGDEVIYLRQRGVADEVIEAMIQRGAELRERSAKPASAAPVASQPPPQQPVPPSTTVTSVGYYNSYPTLVYPLRPVVYPPAVAPSATPARVIQQPRHDDYYPRVGINRTPNGYLPGGPMIKSSRPL